MIFQLFDQTLNLASDASLSYLYMVYESTVIFFLLFLDIIVIFYLLFSLLGLYLQSEYGTISKPMTGVRCPTCAANGQESWVIPGKTCGYCGTGC